MCDYENSCIYYQDYAKKVRKNNMAKERKYINKLKAEVDKCKYKGLNSLSEEFKQNMKMQLTNALNKKEENYENEFGKKLKFGKPEYPSLSRKECTFCPYRIHFAGLEHRKAKRNSKFDAIVLAEDNYRKTLAMCLNIPEKKDMLIKIAEYHKKLIQEKSKNTKK